MKNLLNDPPPNSDKAQAHLMLHLGTHAPTMVIPPEDWDMVPLTKKWVKAQRKPLQIFKRLRVLTDEDVEEFVDNSQETTTKCKDPGRTVISRTWVAEFCSLHPTMRGYLPSSIMNQLVLLASYQLPRMPITIRANTKFLYLLMEVQEPQIFPIGVLVADWILANQDWCINEARIRYQRASREGAMYKSQTHPRQLRK